MGSRIFLNVDPRSLRLPPTRRTGADPAKLDRQIRRYGDSMREMPVLQVSRGSDGGLVINDGVTRAVRMAMLAPGRQVKVEVIDELRVPVSDLPAVGDLIP